MKDADFNFSAVFGTPFSACTWDSLFTGYLFHNTFSQPYFNFHVGPELYFTISWTEKWPSLQLLPQLIDKIATGQQFVVFIVPQLIQHCTMRSLFSGRQTSQELVLSQFSFFSVASSERISLVAWFVVCISLAGTDGDSSKIERKVLLPGLTRAFPLPTNTSTRISRVVAQFPQRWCNQWKLAARNKLLL